MITIINSGTSNLYSVMMSLERLNIKYRLTDSPDVVERSEKVLFPGVGHASFVMDDIKAKELGQSITELTNPYLGICLGMQLLYDSTTEGNVKGLGIFNGNVTNLKATKDFNVPNMGWRNLVINKECPLLYGIDERDFFYFTHSYMAPITNQSVATIDTDDNQFCVLSQQDNFFATQFHPEISGKSGATLLKNFGDL